MLRYIVKRVILAVATVFIIAAITFFTMNAIPGGPFASEKAPSEAVKKVLEARYNLDKPVGEQFIIYIKNFLHGDLGVSLKTGVLSHFCEARRNGGGNGSDCRLNLRQYCGAEKKHIHRPFHCVYHHAFYRSSKLCACDAAVICFLYHIKMVARV